MKINQENLYVDIGALKVWTSEIPEAANNIGDEIWALEPNICIVHSNTTRENKRLTYTLFRLANISLHQASQILFTSAFNTLFDQSLR